MVLKVLDVYGVAEYCIQGSFSNGSFHFEESTCSTFSDLDLVIMDVENANELARKISNYIKLKCNIKLPVSIHSHNSLAIMSRSASQDLAVLECIYQRKKNSFQYKGYRQYLFCKFALLLQRIDASIPEVNTPIKEKKNKALIEICNGVKNGTIGLPTDLLDSMNWPNPDFHKKFWNNFYADTLVEKDVLSTYHSIIRGNNIPSKLIERIEEKMHLVKMSDP